MNCYHKEQLSAPPNWVYVGSLDLMRVVCRLPYSALYSSGLVECMRSQYFGRCLVLVIIWPELSRSRSLNSVQWSGLAWVLGMHFSVASIWLMLNSRLLHYLSMHVVLVRIQSISRVSGRKSTSSPATYQPLVSVWIWSCESIFVVCPVICLLSGIAVRVLVLVATYSALTMLTHRNELLIRISLALWWNVFL